VTERTRSECVPHSGEPHRLSASRVSVLETSRSARASNPGRSAGTASRRTGSFDHAEQQSAVLASSSMSRRASAAYRTVNEIFLLGFGPRRLRRSPPSPSASVTNDKIGSPLARRSGVQVRIAVIGVGAEVLFDEPAAHPALQPPTRGHPRTAVCRWTLRRVCR
jgi:hypothetical protein